MDKPIIASLLDTDFYKFTMGQLVFKKYRDIPVTYAFKNRTKGVELTEFIDEEELREQLDNMRTLKFNNSELHYLRGTNEYGERMFSEDYLQFLKNLRLPSYNLKKVDKNYTLQFSGKWTEAIYWEVPALAIINELYYRGVTAHLSRFECDTVYATGKTRLAEKIKLLRTRPMLPYSDFGTRRRFSKEWQDYVVGVMAEEMPGQFLGTSNTYLAMKYGLLPMGTSAHEMEMVIAAILLANNQNVRGVHQRVLRDWWEEYGQPLSIILPDTFGSDAFFEDMTPEQARDWKGSRQDSGDPIEFGDKKVIPFYENHKVDPKDKLIVFSDGLNADRMIKNYDHFNGRIKVTFGWGTNLTNDLGFKPLSLVIKTVEACGHGLVKLSDNIAKAIGKPEDIEKYKKIFDYKVTLNETCVY